MKNVINKIEALNKKPPAKQPQFTLSELDQILERYAPSYPGSMSHDELYDCCRAFLNYGFIKGATQARRKR